MIYLLTTPELHPTAWHPHLSNPTSGCHFEPAPPPYTLPPFGIFLAKEHFTVGCSQEI
ncbi:hypothetical protein B9Z19DRAFT_608411 [Tuber borchii]|uniref:Uncharacterized protein n=1 Tax=Tuber borchii TaxID=42251 RepID=A0A2T6ZBN8_TUBBO|nr:hypothetical protein B9Z19DRAFT_608411 [Tuber borchii]